jgi:hypothetical protein
MGSVEFRTLDPYQSTRPFNVEPAQFDFMRDGRALDSVMAEGQQRKREMWEPNPQPEFQFRQDPNRPPPTPGFWDSLSAGGKVAGEMYESLPDSDFAKGFLEDDVAFDALGEINKADRSTGGDSFVDFAKESGRNLWSSVKDRSPERLAGNMLSVIPEEAKLALGGAKAALLGGKAALAAKGTGTMMSAVPLARLRSMAQRENLKNPVGVTRMIDYLQTHFDPSMTEDQARTLMQLSKEVPINQSGHWDDVVHGMRGREPRSLVELSRGNVSGGDIDEANETILGVLNRANPDASIITPRRQTPRTGPFKPPAPVVHPDLQTIEDVVQEPVEDLGRAGAGGYGPKRLMAKVNDERIVHKGSPYHQSPVGAGSHFSPAEIAKMPRENAIAEQTSSRLSNAFNKKTPPATAVAEGGIILPFEHGNFSAWHEFPYPEEQAYAQDPEVVKQVAREMVGDTYLKIPDRHPGQFIYDPSRRLFIGVDKGQADLDAIQRGLPLPPGGIYGGFYDKVRRNGVFNQIASQRPDFFTDAAGEIRQIPEAHIRSILDPWVKEAGLNSSESDDLVRNMMQRMHDPNYWSNFHSGHIK